MKDQDQQTIKGPRMVIPGDARWGLAWGLVLVLVGVALLLDHMGVAPFGQLYKFWPLLLVLLGLMNISTQAGRGLGFVLVVIGVLFQLNTLGYLHLSFRDFWPIVIIAVGVLLLWGSLGSRGYVKKPKIDWTQPGAGEAFRNHFEAADSTDPRSLNAVAIFGGCERRFSGESFQGGKAVAVFGGVELDFRDADMEGDEAILEISCLFGGVEVRVPETWTIHSRSMPLFGGFEDKSRRVKVVDATGATKTKTLIITGVVIFGGVEISN